MPRVNKKKLNNLESGNLLKVNQNIIKQKQIILKINEENSWIWKGISEKDESFQEEPSVLEFDNKKYYFYSNGIEKKNYKKSTRRTELYKRLDYFYQEKLLKTFTKKREQEDWDNLILFTLKIDFLYSITNVLYKNLYKKDIFLTNKFSNLKDKFIFEYQSLINTIGQGADKNLAVGKFEKIVIRNLKNRKGNLYEKIKKLVEKFEIKNPEFSITDVDKITKKKDLDLVEEEEILNSNQKSKQKFKVILLRNNVKQSCIWKGLVKKDEDSLEDYAVLNFDDQDYYFYFSGVEKKDYNYGSNFFKLYKDLDYFNQDQLLKLFVKHPSQENWYRPMLLKMKAEFLDNLANVLYENLDKNDNIPIAEFTNLKVKFVSDYHSLMTEIKSGIDNNLNNNYFESFIVKDLKNKKNSLYKKFEKLIEIFKEENIDFNKLEEKDLKVQKLFLFNSKEKNELRSKIILLRNLTNHSWLWRGETEKDEDSLEEPVVLKLDGKKLYFYSKGIEKRDYKYNNNILRLYKNLNYFHQEQLLKGFIEKTNQEDWHKSTVIKMKVNFLNTMADILYENLYKTVNLSTIKFDNLKDKFISDYQNLMTEIKAEDSESINDNMMIYDFHLGNFFKSLKNEKGKLYDKFETLIKHLKEENSFLQKDFLMISLKYYQNNSLIWKGEAEKDESSLEEPAILNFANKDYYFYPSQIAKRQYNYNKKFFKLYSKLDYFHQEELLKKFIKQNQEKTWYKPTLLKMKSNFLDNLADFLIDNLDENESLSSDEFNDLKIKFVSEYKNLMTEIDEVVDNNLDINKFETAIIRNLKNRKGSTYYKFEKLVKKFKIEKFEFDELMKNFDNQELPFKFKHRGQMEFKTILLKNIKSYSLLWRGIRKKDEDSLEEFAVLNFDDQDYYFYPSQITKKNYRSSTRSTELYKRLNYFQQGELLKIFAKQENQEEWYKPVLVRMKVTFLDTLADVLSENLDKNGNLSLNESINFKDKFISEYQSLIAEIELDADINRTDIVAIKHLKNKKGKFYDKFEKLVEKITKDNELLSVITENNSCDSLINDMITDDKYQEYLASENLLFDLENDNNISINVIDDLEEFASPVLKKRKLNNLESENLLSLNELTDLNDINFSRENKKKMWDLDISELVERDLLATELLTIENNQNTLELIEQETRANPSEQIMPINVSNKLITFQEEEVEL